MLIKDKKESRVDGKKVYLIIDAHALIHRAYHAMPFLVSKNGTPSGALFGLTNMLLQAIEKFQPTDMVAAFDLPEETFRHAAFVDYKANRKSADDALVDQIVLAPNIFESFGIPCLSRPGFEADDIIGTLVKKAQAENKTHEFEIIIFTGDMDIMQLVDENIFVYTGKKGEEDILYDEERIKEKFDLLPKQIPDYKGLRGDTSDNIPGIKGIGEKTAGQILKAGYNLENIYKMIEDGKTHEDFGITKRMFELLVDGKDDATFSKELATIHCGVEIDFEYTNKYSLLEHAKNLKDICDEYDFTSIRRKIERAEGLSKEIDDIEFATVGVDKKEIESDEVKNSKEEKDEKKEKNPEHNFENIEFESDVFKKCQIALWLLDSAETNPDVSRLVYKTKKNNQKDILEYLEKAIEKEGLEELYFDMELPLIDILNESNRVGIEVDREELKKLLKRYESELKQVESDIFKYAGHEFNINSPKQLGVVLFDEMGLGKSLKLKKTKNGDILQMSMF